MKKQKSTQSAHPIVLFEQDSVRLNEILTFLNRPDIVAYSSFGLVKEHLQSNPHTILLLNIFSTPEDGFQLVRSLQSSGGLFPKCILYSFLSLSTYEQNIANEGGAYSIVSVKYGMKSLLDTLLQTMKADSILSENNKPQVSARNAESLSKELKRLKAENEGLHSSEIRYKSYFESASFPIFVLDPKKDDVLEMNEQAERFLGYSKAELKKMRTLPFVSPSTQLRDIVNWGIQLTNNAIMRTKSGDLVDVELTAGIVEQSTHGVETVSFLILYIKDVTEQRRLREQLVQAEKMSLLGRLSAGIAHEIRNPLTAVKINLQEFDLQTSKTHPLRESLSLALEGVEQIEQIIESTLEFARPTKPDRQKADINDILEKSFSFAKSSLNKKKIQLEIHLTMKLPYVYVDPQQIQQVFLNLISNAIDASRSSTKIEVKTFLKKDSIPNIIPSNAFVEQENFLSADKNDFVVVEFKDYGMGITRDQIDHIFEPFFTTKAKGTGLGLAICKQILELHNAFISISSSKEEGTSFLCFFPVLANGKPDKV